MGAKGAKGAKGKTRHRKTAHRDNETSAPLRLCAVTRERRGQNELIRFIVAPDDGRIVPDLRGRLPGRGVWLTAERGIVEQAVRKQVFARSLARKVVVPDDLADEVERLLVARAMQYLSLANKAGLVVSGFAKIERAIGRTRITALLHASDGASDGASKLDRKAAAASAESGRGVRIVTLFGCDELSLALGRSNVVHAAMMQGGVALAFLREASRVGRYRAGEVMEVADETALDTDKA